jgi:hypothetical protein
MINDLFSDSTLIAIDFVSNPLTLMPSIIDSNGVVYTYDSGNYTVVDTSTIKNGTPVAIS